MAIEQKTVLTKYEDLPVLHTAHRKVPGNTGGTSCAALGITTVVSFVCNDVSFLEKRKELTFLFYFNALEKCLFPSI